MQTIIKYLNANMIEISIFVVSEIKSIIKLKLNRKELK
jgi:flagellar biosynthesis regulator FlaF